MDEVPYLLELHVEYIAGILTALSGFVVAITGLLIVVFRRMQQVQQDMKAVTKNVNGIVDERVKSARAEGHAQGVVQGIEKSWREGGASKKVLIVDDEKMVVEVSRILLASAGYLVFTANDGIDAIQKVEVVRPDLILLDWQMPLMHGSEAVKWLCEITSAPIVIITGYPEEVMDGFDILVKPVEPRMLLSKVESFFKDRK